MSKVIIIFLFLTLLGCSSINAESAQSEKSYSKAEDISEKTIDKFTFDPLSKVKNVDLVTYYSRVFKDLKPYLKERYPDAYVSSPNAYAINDVITAYTPWLPTSSEYTIFPTAHYLLLTEITDTYITTHRFNHEQVIALLKRDYEVIEETSPFFHYVLKLTSKQKLNFEQDITVKLKQLQHESTKNDLL